MQINLVVKRVLVISAKQAVNALLTNSALSALFPRVFEVNPFHSGAALLVVAKLALGTIAVREAMVWGPVVLKWSQENLNFTNGGS